MHIDFDPKRLRQLADVKHKAEISMPNSDLGIAVSMYTENFGRPKRVLYSACGSHVIDRLFPQSEIVYVDPSIEAVQALKDAVREKAGAIAAGIENYNSQEEFDLVFSLNSHASMGEQLRHVASDGYVFCNNYFGTQDAERIIKLGTFDLVAVIYVEYVDGKPLYATIEKSGLEDYLAPNTDPKLPELYPQRKKIGEYYVFHKA